MRGHKPKVTLLYVIEDCLMEREDLCEVGMYRIDD